MRLILFKFVISCHLTGSLKKGVSFEELLSRYVLVIHGLPYSFGNNIPMTQIQSVYSWPMFDGYTWTVG